MIIADLLFICKGFFLYIVAIWINGALVF